MILNLTISETLLKEMEKEGERTFPREGCGLIFGKFEKETAIVSKITPLPNKGDKNRPDRYRISPEDRRLAEKVAEKEGLSLIGFFHSHPNHDVYFSETDLENSEEYQFGEPWVEPSYVYIVVSVFDKKTKDFGAFVVDKGRAKKIEVKITPHKPGGKS